MTLIFATIVRSLSALAAALGEENEILEDEIWYGIGRKMENGEKRKGEKGEREVTHHSSLISHLLQLSLLAAITR